MKDHRVFQSIQMINMRMINRNINLFNKNLNLQSKVDRKQPYKSLKIYRDLVKNINNDITKTRSHSKNSSIIANNQQSKYLGRK